jgi:predicted NUDIX family NTP pyrophosphohydrolase
MSPPRFATAAGQGESVASPKQTTARPNLSAGILACRRGRRGLEVLLVHPGGPYWRNKDDGAWSIPKGEIGTSEDPEQAARREFAEELGPAASIGPLQALGENRQRGGKCVIAFWGEADFDTASLSSNTFEIEWPPKSGRLQAFPEVDRAEWFDLEAARSKILSGQIVLIDRLEAATR